MKKYTHSLNLFYTMLSGVLILACALPVHAEQEKTILIISKNLTEQTWIDFRLQNFEKAVQAGLSSNHFRIISRDAAVQKMSALLRKDVTWRQSGLERFSVSEEGAKIEEQATESKDTSAVNDDEQTAKKNTKKISGPKKVYHHVNTGPFSDIANASRRTVLQLAQSLEADYVLYISIGTFRFLHQPPARGMQSGITTYRLTTHYDILETVTGASIASDRITKKKKILTEGGDHNTSLEKTEVSSGSLLITEFNRDSRSTKEQNLYMFETLMESSAESLADSVRDVARRGQLKPVPDKKSNQVVMRVIAQTSELGNLLTFFKDEFSGENEYGSAVERPGTEQPIQSVMNVTVQLNDLVLGSTGDNPDKLTNFWVHPGRHLLKVMREGYEPFEQEIYIPKRKGPHDFVVSLSFTEESLVQTRELTEYLQGLKLDQKIADTKAEILKAYVKHVQEHGVFLRDPEGIESVTQYADRAVDTIIGLNEDEEDKDKKKDKKEGDGEDSESTSGTNIKLEIQANAAE